MCVFVCLEGMYVCVFVCLFAKDQHGGCVCVCVCACTSRAHGLALVNTYPHSLRNAFSILFAL